MKTAIGHIGWFLASVALFTGANSPVAAGQERHGSLTDDLSHGAVLTVQIGHDLPEYTFKISPKITPDDEFGNHQSTVKDIKVFRGKSKLPIQHLTGCGWSDMEAPYATADWFGTGDYNFDGYQDVFLVTTQGSHSTNRGGCIWLFRPSTGRFVFSKEFSDIFPEIRPDKTLFTFWNGGMMGAVHSAAVYRVESGHPVRMWSQEENYDFDTKRFHCVVTERRENTIVTVTDKYSEPGDSEPPCDASSLLRGAHNE